MCRFAYEQISDIIKKLNRKLAECKAQNQALKDALEAVEYKVDFDCYDDDGKCMSFCVDCGQPKGEGHHSNCKIGNALKQARGEERVSNQRV